MEGRRPLLAEVQALVTPTPRSSDPAVRRPGSTARGSRWCSPSCSSTAGIRLHGHDVFASTVGGAKLTDPASDLAVAVALASADLRQSRRPPAWWRWARSAWPASCAGSATCRSGSPRPPGSASRWPSCPPSPASSGVRTRAERPRRSTGCGWSRRPTSPPRCGCSTSIRRTKHALEVVDDRLDSPGHRVRPRCRRRTGERQCRARTLATRCCACARRSPSIAPGTALRDGLERILRGRTGALIVLGHDRVVESISTGGFELDVPFTATGLRELAKMDGGIILDKDITRIIRAAVHLMPDHTIPSEETGTRHRTADRVARQTGFPVISVSQSMQIIAAYVGDDPPRARGLRPDPVPGQPGAGHPGALQAAARRGLQHPLRARDRGPGHRARRRRGRPAAGDGHPDRRARSRTTCSSSAPTAGCCPCSSRS